jgi:hypothetical protein
MILISLYFLWAEQVIMPLYKSHEDKVIPHALCTSLQVAEGARDQLWWNEQTASHFPFISLG